MPTAARKFVLSTVLTTAVGVAHAAAMHYRGNFEVTARSGAGCMTGSNPVYHDVDVYLRGDAKGGG